LRIACFITSHGFGHATRSLALLNKLAEKENLNVFIFSTLPAWFFQENLNGISYKYHHIETDVGLVQKSPFLHDLNLTIDRLTTFLDFKKEETEPILQILEKELFDFIFCDISPLGLYLGNKLNIPTCLLENFTWEWIYESYLFKNQNFKRPIEKLKDIVSKTNLHIQTNPICKPDENLLQINPIFRTWRQSKLQTIEQIGINIDKPIILITTGGISQKFSFLEKIKKDDKHFYLITGDYSKMEKGKNYILIPQKNDFYFPDLVQLSDGVVGKAGYGTVAEVWGAQKPLIGIFRDDFRESVPMRNFVQKNIAGFEVSKFSFQQGDWIPKVEQLLSEPPKCSSTIENGSEEAALIISKWSKNGFITEGN
jgi:UDP-N-acetylglucosamine:LPS N-acetylglucosamine transferase